MQILRKNNNIRYLKKVEKNINVWFYNEVFNVEHASPNNYA